MERKLIRQIKRVSKTIKRGESIDLMYDGQSIANYEFTEWTIDSKTPEDWLRGCIFFVIKYRGRDINKVSLKYTRYE
jgi:hypothetical protein